MTGELFRAEKLPIYQNKMFASEHSALSCPTGDVVLAQDGKTGLVSNVAFNATLLDYDQQYQNEQACSGVFQRHLESVTNILDRYCRGKTLLEVGCGKGYFLEQLLGLGYHVRGIDPAYEGNSPAVVKAHFEPGLGLSGDCLVLRHVLEHVPNPLAFLAKTAQANAGSGIIYIEVPCFDWICRHRAWFDVFYEHVNYLRLDDLLRMFAVVHEAGHLFGGQYLYVVADLASVRTPRCSDSVEFPADFLSGLDHLISLLASGKRRAVWGAAAKGMMVALHLKRAGIPVDVAIDINPAKQGKYLAGSGVCVLSPSDALNLVQPGDEILIANSQYSDEIIALSDNNFRYLSVDNHELCQRS